jgi:hypothetical protein
MFLYSFTAAVLHREDTRDVMLPPPYEVNPHLFVQSDVIQNAYKYWMMSKAHCTLCVPLQELTLVINVKMRWAGHVARMGERRGAYRALVGKPEGRRPLGGPRRRWEDNIKMHL